MLTINVVIADHYHSGVCSKLSRAQHWQDVEAPELQHFWQDCKRDIDRHRRCGHLSRSYKLVTASKFELQFRFCCSVYEEKDKAQSVIEDGVTGHASLQCRPLAELHVALMTVELRRCTCSLV